MAKRVLILGESWITRSATTKGFDSFYGTMFGERYSPLREVLRAGAFDVDVIEGHAIPARFPTDLAALTKYSAIILSDVGANTFLLTSANFENAVPGPNRLQLLAEYTRQGGGLVMVGGYLTFMGLNGCGFWHSTPVEGVLPVVLQASDDRVEHNSGVRPSVRLPGHPILRGVDGVWPDLLGYNRVTAHAHAEVVATVGGDPLLVLGRSGLGRSVAFTTDCSPHWCPQPFMDWVGYAALWCNICAWVAAEM